ncbi:MAG: VCBS repeat-containing protein [Gemmatimonadota bacterium]|nr:VCBS repeat-containing protein [Gemmatimonadota bacterium]
MHHSRLIALFTPFLWLAGCSGKGDRPVFKLLSPEETGVTFANTITTNDSLNVQTDVYVYNGAGVAVGDIDNDGLPDIFFSGNMVSSRLYRNKGNMKFEDITDRAGVHTSRWATGASMVDINNDGYLDIYVSVSGPEWSKPEQRANLLFVNDGKGKFTEQAAKYGIADTNFTTHAVFLDYDKDGCVDLFLLNNSPKDFSRGVTSHPTGMRGNTPGSYNELYRNNCNGTFTNVSEQAGILRDAGYGLGVVVADLNRDGWPDIYVSNDGTPNDVVYINNHDGTFTNKAAKWLKHASQAGMGVDAADFNNDGWTDILQVDMMPRDFDRRKRVSGFMTYGNMLDTRSRGFRDDYSENSLQLSNGVTKEGDVVFSEIARLAGVAHTDWSWSALFADFDNDGYKDIFIGNGYPKAVNDLDYMNALYAARDKRDVPRARRLLTDLPSYQESNYLFRNNGDLTFTDVGKQWGIDKPSFSYGAAYADLNNDGRLDLVINNIDGPAFIYANVAPRDDAHHFLEVRLQGEQPRERTAGIGAEVAVSAGGKKQYIYYSPYRGYMSTNDDRAHFGLGGARRVDSLEVDWPDGRRQVLTNLPVDRLITVKQTDATEKRPPDALAVSATSPSQWFQPLSLAGLKYSQPAPSQVDYDVQPLLPYLISRHGPPVAVADVNGDGLADVFIGDGHGVPGKLFIQRKDGSFVESSQGQPWEADKVYEDWGAVFFDANGDGLPDLYVVSGGYQLAPSSPLLQDRLYINKGRGRFAADPQALPPMLTSKATVRVGDFNGDGRPDLFVGGRLTPRNYPYPTRSYILRNDGGHFTDVTESVAPELVTPGGMVTDAAWIDFDGDGRLDLVTVGDWMPIRFYHNDGNKLRDVTQSMQLPPSRGWWSSLAVGDFDRDGRPDLVAGNLGLNYTYTTSKDTTFEVYATSFAGSQATDIILAQKVDGKEYPYAGMATLGRAIYPLTMRFPTYGSFAHATMNEALGSAQLQRALHYEADTFSSVYLHNEGGGKFSWHALPTLAQISPIKAILAEDVDGDGHLDLIVAGNLYDTEPNTARADAGNGLWLRGDGRNHFTPVAPAQSGFLAPLNVSGLARLDTPAGRAVLVANTSDSLQIFRIRKR